MKQLFIYCSLLISTTFLYSCNSDSNEGELIVHPITDKIPHSDVPGEKFTVLNAGEYLNELPENIRLLYRTLNDDDFQKDAVELNLLTSSEIDLKSLNDSTIIILDKKQNRLLSYSLFEHQSGVIAEQGRGPNDLIFAEELSVYNNKLYVASQSFQISVFNCQSNDCVHEDIIQSNYSVYSISPKDEDIYYLGLMPYGHEREIENGAEYSVHRANHTGDVDLSFLPKYEDDSPLVTNRIMSEGKVRSSSEYDKIIVTYHYFPYLFLYNLSGDLVKKHEIPGFLRAKNIESEIGELSTTLTFNGDYTYLRYTKIINNEWLFIKTQEYRDVNYEYSDRKIYGDTWYSYFIYSLKDEKFYKIGDDSIREYGELKKFHLSKSDVFLNDNGRIYWIK